MEQILWGRLKTCQEQLCCEVRAELPRTTVTKPLQGSPSSLSHSATTPTTCVILSAGKRLPQVSASLTWADPSILPQSAPLDYSSRNPQLCPHTHMKVRPLGCGVRLLANTKPPDNVKSLMMLVAPGDLPPTITTLDLKDCKKEAA